MLTLFTFFTQRIAAAIPVLLAVVTLIFFVVRVLPGDPAQAALGENASAATVATLRTRMGLDAPLHVQYATFLSNLVRGDLGVSMINGASVREQIAYNLPFTLQLTLAAMIIGLAAGIPLGVWTALHRNGPPDVLGRTLSLAGLSIPAFYLGILLMLLFAVRLQVLPAIGGGATPAEMLAALVLPALTLGAIMTAQITRLVRSAMLDTLPQEYVRTARAKGVRERTVLVLHTLRPALLPIVSLTGVWAIALIGDSVTTEVVFSRPGLGKLMVGAMLQRDYTSLESIMVVYTVFVVAINVVTDLTYGLIDPRVRNAYG
jgi:ABC-type dipeptide/oligopeptide/nickel transport system permease component